MANAQRGEVSLETPDGKTYVLKLTTNRMLALEKEADTLTGIARTRFVLHAALTAVESQQAVTLADAGDLIDDIGLTKVNELIDQTKWGVMAKRFIDEQKAKENGHAATAEGAARPPVSTGASVP